MVGLRGHLSRNYFLCLSKTFDCVRRRAIGASDRTRSSAIVEDLVAFLGLDFGFGLFRSLLVDLAARGVQDFVDDDFFPLFFADVPLEVLVGLLAGLAGACAS